MGQERRREVRARYVVRSLAYCSRICLVLTGGISEKNRLERWSDEILRRSTNSLMSKCPYYLLSVVRTLYIIF